MKLLFSTLLFCCLLNAATAQVITTIAGNGTVGYTGDGSAAILAGLNQPQGLAVDHAGNVYFADVANNVIRKVVVKFQ